jgi:hypothetical protein
VLRLGQVTGPEFNDGAAAVFRARALNGEPILVPSDRDPKIAITPSWLLPEHVEAAMLSNGLPREWRYAWGSTVRALAEAVAKVVSKRQGLPPVEVVPSDRVPSGPDYAINVELGSASLYSAVEEWIARG